MMTITLDVSSNASLAAKNDSEYFYTKDESVLFNYVSKYKLAINSLKRSDAIALLKPEIDQALYAGVTHKRVSEIISLIIKDQISRKALIKNLCKSPSKRIRGKSLKKIGIQRRSTIGADIYNEVLEIIISRRASHSFSHGDIKNLTNALLDRIELEVQRQCHRGRL